MKVQNDDAESILKMRCPSCLHHSCRQLLAWFQSGSPLRTVTSQATVGAYLTSSSAGGSPRDLFPFTSGPHPSHIGMPKGSAGFKETFASNSQDRTYPNPEVREARARLKKRQIQKVDAAPSKSKEAKVMDPSSTRMKPQQRYIPGPIDKLAELSKGDGCLAGCWKRVFEREDIIMSRLMQEVDWLEREVVVHGKTHMQPRKIAYMADSQDLSYSYSGQTMVPRCYSPTVQMIKKRLEESGFGVPLKFNCVLLNLYRDGMDHVSWHSDNETLFGENPVIGSVSFGVERDFVLKAIEEPARKYLYKLGGGDVLVMAGATQSKYMHCVPRRKSLARPRINLTFRNIVAREEDVLE